MGATEDECSDWEDSGPVQAELEIYSWWVSSPEREGLEALTREFQENHPGSSVTNVGDDPLGAPLLSEIMEAGLPPDTFQANLGDDLLQWVDPPVGSRIVPLDCMFRKEAWLDAYPSKVIEGLQQDDRLYGVPLRAQRINSLYYDKRLFDEHGLEPPQTLAELNALVEAIKQSETIQASEPDGVAPLALGNGWQWTLPLLTFEMILPAVAGVDYYESFWKGGADPADGPLQEALDEALFLYCGDTPATCDGYFNDSIDDSSWTEGVYMLVNGAAAMAPMGSWASAYLNAQGMVEGEDFGVVPFPQKSGMAPSFVVSVHVFSLPDTPPSPEGARAFLRTVGSLDAQLAVAAAAGGIPARSDFAASGYANLTPFQQTLHDEYKSQPLGLTSYAFITDEQFPDLDEKLHKSLSAGETAGVMEYIESQYDTL